MGKAAVHPDFLQFFAAILPQWIVVPATIAAAWNVCVYEGSHCAG